MGIPPFPNLAMRLCHFATQQKSIAIAHGTVMTVCRSFRQEPINDLSSRRFTQPGVASIIRGATWVGGMSDLLAHMMTWLGAALADGSAFFLLCLLLFATVILNRLTGVSDPPRMAGNFCSLVVGAALGPLLLPD